MITLFHTSLGRLAPFAVLLFATVATAQIVKDPEADFLRQFEASDSEELIRTERDLNGDGVPEVLISLGSFLNGRQGNVWVLYRSLPTGGYERVDLLNDGGVIEFGRNVVSVQPRADGRGSKLVRYSPAGGGRGLLTSYDLEALGQNVIREISPRENPADSAMFDGLFNDPATRLRFEFSAVGDVEGGTRVRVNQIEASQFPEVTIYATVSHNGSALVGLSPENFRVWEDEVDLNPTAVEAATEPLSLLLVAELSPGMKNVETGVPPFETALQSGLRTSDKVEVKRSVQDAGAMLNDGLKTLGSKSGRRALILLTSQGKNVDAGYSHALSSGIPVYVIGVGAPEDELALRALAAATGGRYITVTGAAQLTQAGSTLGQKLANQYAVRFKSPWASEGVRNVRLTLTESASKPYAVGKDLSDEQIAELAATAGLANLVDEFKLEVDLQPATAKEAKPLPLVINGSGTVDASGRDIIICAANANVRLLGNCGQVSVSGVGNQIQAAQVKVLSFSGHGNSLSAISAAVVVFTGNDNRATLKSGSPPKQDTGSNNTLNNP